MKRSLSILYCTGLLATVVVLGCTSPPRDFASASFGLSLDPTRSEVVTPEPLAKEPAPKAETEDEPEHWNHLAFSIGAIAQRNEEGVRLALEYERLLTAQVGVGAMAEADTRPVDGYSLLVPVFFHPVPRLGLIAAPGYNFRTDSDEEDGFMLRLGITWKFEVLERFCIVPEVYYDILEGGERGGVVALAFGVGF